MKTHTLTSGGTDRILTCARRRRTSDKSYAFCSANSEIPIFSVFR
nr:MAG TPA: hypothetical protein [Caudoviricetes sp.]